MERRNALSEKQEIELTSGSTTHGRGKKKNLLRGEGNSPFSLSAIFLVPKEYHDGLDLDLVLLSHAGERSVRWFARSREGPVEL